MQPPHYQLYHWDITHLPRYNQTIVTLHGKEQRFLGGGTRILERYTLPYIPNEGAVASIARALAHSQAHWDIPDPRLSHVQKHLNTPTQQPGQLVKTYKRNLFGSAEGKFDRDAARLAREGWSVQSHASDTSTGRAFSITVVYVKAYAASQPPESE